MYYLCCVIYCYEYFFNDIISYLLSGTNTGMDNLFPA